MLRFSLVLFASSICVHAHVCAWAYNVYYPNSNNYSIWYIFRWMNYFSWTATKQHRWKKIKEMPWSRNCEMHPQLTHVRFSSRTPVQSNTKSQQFERYCTPYAPHYMRHTLTAYILRFSCFHLLAFVFSLVVSLFLLPSLCIRSPSLACRCCCIRPVDLCRVFCA